MNGNDLIIHINKYPEVQSNFLLQYGIDPSTKGKIVEDLFNTEEFMNFVLEDISERGL